MIATCWPRPSPRLSSRFVVALDEVFIRLTGFTRSAPPVAGSSDVPRAVVRGFPHVVFYRPRPVRIDAFRVPNVVREGADRLHPDQTPQ